MADKPASYTVPAMSPRVGAGQLTSNDRVTSNFRSLGARFGIFASSLLLVMMAGSGCAGLAGPSSSTNANTNNGSQAAIVANPSSLKFGDVSVGTTSSQSVTLQNNSSSNVTISSISVKGAGYSTSGVSSGAILSPTQTATLSVSFEPASNATDNGSIAISSNASNSPLSVSVSGTGVTGHSVALTWDASGSSGVVGYNIYRGTVSGLYKQLNSSLIAPTSYTDSTVQSGENITYYYVVTAVNSSGVESTDSNQVTALVP